MADPIYKNVNFILDSKGITARFVTDAAPEGTYLNMDNVEELAERSVSPRLGSAIINKTGSVVDALPGAVHSLAKLSGLGGSEWRYAGQGQNLWRRAGTGNGSYTLIASDMSAGPWQAQSDAPTPISGIPFIFIADSAGMIKDNGNLSAPQQMGIFQPQNPMQAQALNPDLIVLDYYTLTNYTTSGLTTFNPNITISSTTLTSAVTTPGIQAVSVANPNMIGLFQLLRVGFPSLNQETVLVLGVTSTGFVANFSRTHVIGHTVVMNGTQAVVAPSTTATIANAWTSKLISGWPTTLNMEDYIGLWIGAPSGTSPSFDPSQIQSITLRFDCGDGTFESDYFYKVIAQGPLQNLLNTANSNTTEATTAATDALLYESLGIYSESSTKVGSSSSIAQLNTGINTWTPLLLQLSDFAGSGRADFNDPVFNWSNVNGYQLTIVMNNTTSVTIDIASLILFGGSGPDTFAGVAYDYLFTFYNNVDGTESNPCMVMSNINPPLQTNWVYPRRQPVQVTMTYPTVDPQTTSLRIYRRGGTLGDNYRRLNEVLITGSPQTYLDTSTDVDIQQSDIISFTNDVPVTSTLQNPVNTTLNTAITTTNQVVNVYPTSMANISVAQQVSIGVVGAIANNFETVIVLALGSNYFTAFVQNTHVIGETISATAKYGQPVTIMAQAYGQFWFAGDPNNPNSLYWSASNYPQAVSSAAYVAVTTADDPITVIAAIKGNLYVSTLKGGWFSVAPGSNANASPTIYPTASKHGCIASLGFVVTEEGVFYQAIDGVRFFAGGASMYLTQDLEFIFQGVGSSPIVEADQTKLSQTRMAYWNTLVYVSYIGTDGARHRLCLHTHYKRWRNDDCDAQSLLLEVDTNTLLYGDSNGLVHIDRQDQFYDEGNNAGALIQNPIAMVLQTPFTDVGNPASTKSLQELTIDVNTAGQTLTVTLLFEDGQQSFVVGTVTTAERQKVNFSLNSGAGYEYYKVSVLLTGSVSEAVYVYQIGLKALPLAKTRKVMDTFWLRLSQDSNSIAKDSFWEFTSSSVITVNVYYDGSSTAFFTFTLPNTSGVRSQQRVRLPAVSFKMIRFIATSPTDFQIWGDESCIESKPQVVGKGYAKMPFMPNG